MKTKSSNPFSLFSFFLEEEGEGEEEGVGEPTQDPLLSAMAEKQRDVEVLFYNLFEIMIIYSCLHSI